MKRYDPRHLVWIFIISIIMAGYCALALVLVDQAAGHEDEFWTEQVGTVTWYGWMKCPANYYLMKGEDGLWYPYAMFHKRMHIGKPQTSPSCQYLFERLYETNDD